MLMFHTRDPFGVCCGCRPHPCAPCPVKFLVEFEGPLDDDLRVTIDGETVWNPKRNVGTYAGTGWASLPYPPFEYSENLRYGSKVELALFDGWQTGARMSPWVATVFFSDGSTAQFAGGESSSFTSKVYGPVPAEWNAQYGANSYTQKYGPFLDDYYPMGGFVLQHPDYPAKGDPV